jgi:glycosyltransferase involved in cell wall biosynthesis
MQWIRYFLSRGYRVTLSSPSKERDESEWGHVEFPEGVEILPLPLNQSQVDLPEEMATALSLESQAHLGEMLKRLKPDVVMFDRFILEEQFGHWVYQYCPQARVMLETQDLHFVRRARESAKDQYLQVDVGADFYQHGPVAETALREIASIHRVDHTFVVSTFEERLLVDHFEVPAHKVSWVPMVADAVLAGEQPAVGATKKFEERHGFCWVGNFRHQPNIDGLRWFRGEIWPRIRIRFPGAKVHVYGAYPSAEVMQWNRPQDGFHVHGQADTLAKVFESVRVNLAPLRFGAGVKGKILEAMAYQVPTVTTKIGVEGLMAHGQNVHDHFPGLEANTSQFFAETCIALHEDETLWNKMHRRTLELGASYTVSGAEHRIAAAFEQLEKDRAANKFPSFTSRVMRHELMNSHKYFARWIEAKNAPKSAPLGVPATAGAAGLKTDVRKEAPVAGVPGLETSPSVTSSSDESAPDADAPDGSTSQA